MNFFYYDLLMAHNKGLQIQLWKLSLFEAIVLVNFGCDLENIFSE